MKLLIRFSPASFYFVPSLVQILSSAPCPQTLAVCVPLLMSEAKFHIHTKPQAKIRFCVSIFTFLDRRREEKNILN
jgi:hypothetical protein